VGQAPPSALGNATLFFDPGYATLPRLLALTGAESIDAVLVSDRHPDHCADLHPLLRARRMAPEVPAAASTVITLASPSQRSTVCHISYRSAIVRVFP
jgi:ribonuclease BN (tRNA processing enzyme)